MWFRNAPTEELELPTMLVLRQSQGMVAQTALIA